MKLNGDLLRELRENSGLTLKAAATRLNISEATLSRYETNNIQRPAPSVLIGCSKLYRVPINVLYDQPEPDWVSALQESGLRDQRVAGFLQYLDELSEREMNSDSFVVTDEEKELINAFRNADDKTRQIVTFALNVPQLSHNGNDLELNVNIPLGNRIGGDC